MCTLGIAVTKITSMLGILSQKASIRLATETGKKLADKTNQVGRALNQTEIEDVFVKVLPKRCRPKILTTIEQVREQHRNLGIGYIMSEKLLENSKAATIWCGKDKRSIYLPLKKMEKEEIPSVTAHEIEHALELNNRLKGIFERRVQSLLTLMVIMFDENFAAKMYILQKMAGDLESSLQTTIFSNVEKLLGAAPTRENLADSLSTDIKGLPDIIRLAIRKVIDPFDSKTSISDYTILKRVMDAEIPAYLVDGEVERYMWNIDNGKTSPAQAVSMVYREARKILEEERKLFLNMPYKCNGTRNISLCGEPW